MSEKNEAAIVQNLKDAGCSGGTILAFVDDLKEGKTAEGLKLLAAHRRSLLERMHEEQKRIDCLDYLVYTLTDHPKSASCGHIKNSRK